MCVGWGGDSDSGKTSPMSIPPWIQQATYPNAICTAGGDQRTWRNLMFRSGEHVKLWTGSNLNLGLTLRVI